MLPSDSFNSQAALLNKINAATVLDLRINETTNQFLMHMLEQLLVQNKRAFCALLGECHWLTAKP